MILTMFVDKKYKVNIDRKLGLGNPSLWDLMCCLLVMTNFLN